MPPVVHGEQVSGLPSCAVGVEEPDALVDPTLHLVGVHHGVDAPHVVGVGLDRGEAGIQRLAVVTCFLEAERRHAADELGVRVVRGRSPEAFAAGGRAGSGHRRGRSRADGRASARAGRPATGSADRRGAVRRPLQSPSSQAPIAARWACSRSFIVHVGQRVVGASDRRRDRRGQCSSDSGRRRAPGPSVPGPASAASSPARSTTSGWKRTRRSIGTVVQVDRRRRHRSSGCRASRAPTPCGAE